MCPTPFSSCWLSRSRFSFFDILIFYSFVVLSDRLVLFICLIQWKSSLLTAIVETNIRSRTTSSIRVDRPSILFKIDNRRDQWQMSNDRCNRCLKGLSRRIPCFVAWTLLLSSTVLYLVFICPSIVKQFSLIVALIQGIILIFVINNFLMATFTDPGRYGRAPADENDDSETTFHKTGEVSSSSISSADESRSLILFFKLKFTEVNVEWNGVKRVDSIGHLVVLIVQFVISVSMWVKPNVFCYSIIHIWSLILQTFDHHCPWLNNCIGSFDFEPFELDR